MRIITTRGCRLCIHRCQMVTTIISLLCLLATHIHAQQARSSLVYESNPYQQILTMEQQRAVDSFNRKLMADSASWRRGQQEPSIFLPQQHCILITSRITNNRGFRRRHDHHTTRGRQQGHGTACTRKRQHGHRTCTRTICQLCATQLDQGN